MTARSRLAALCAASIAACATAVPLAAQPEPPAPQAVVPVPQVDPAYTAMAKEMIAAEHSDTVLRQGLETLRTTMLAQDPTLAELERQHPGMIDQMIAAMAPTMRQHIGRSTALFSEALVPLLAESLSVEEAQAAIAFYTSDTGRRSMSAMAGNYSAEASLNAALANGGQGEITATDVHQDVQSAAQAAFATLSVEDRVAMIRLTGTGWWRKLNAMGPRILELRTRYENTPMLPEHEAAMERAVLQVVERVLGEAGAQ